jgi:hypothetical protein
MPTAILGLSFGRKSTLRPLRVAEARACNRGQVRAECAADCRDDAASHGRTRHPCAPPTGTSQGQTAQPQTLRASRGSLSAVRSTQRPSSLVGAENHDQPGVSVVEGDSSDARPLFQCWQPDECSLAQKRRKGKRRAGASGSSACWNARHARSLNAIVGFRTVVLFRCNGRPTRKVRAEPRRTYFECDQPARSLYV